MKMAGKLVARIGDSSDHHGNIVPSAANLLTVLVEGLPVAIDGDLLTCPISGHGTCPITATGKFFVNGLRVVVDGDKAICGASVTAGSVKTFA